jgi:hypothetical protein
MPLVALMLYLTLHSVRESAPQNRPDSPSQAAESGTEP